MCVDKLQDDIIIVVPSRETVLFAPAGQTDVIKKMIDHAEKSFEVDGGAITKQIYVFTKAGKELKVYGS